MLQEIPIDQVFPNPDQPRRHFDEKELRALASSIRENGLMQPIVVRPVGDRFQIIAGERRWRAHRILAERGQAKSIRALVNETTDGDMEIQSIVENLQRVDIRPLEEANAFHRAMARGLTPEQLATRIGCLVFRVHERLGLLKLDAQLQKLVEVGALAPTSGYEISKLPARKQMKIFKSISAGKLRGIVEIRAAVDAELAELDQADIFGGSGKATKEELDTVSRMEAKVTAVAGMVSAGWKDGDCIVATKVSPDRSARMAEQLAVIRRHLQIMERELRQVTAQAEMILPGR